MKKEENRGGPRDGSGRPVKPDSEKRKNLVQFKLTDPELKKLMEHAQGGEKQGLTARRLLLEKLDT